MNKTMTGLQKVLKSVGSMVVKSGDKSVTWVWDYANDKPMIKSEMTKEQLAESEKAKWSAYFDKSVNNKTT
jgi:hypothetical protein